MLPLVAGHAAAWNTDWVQDPALIGELRNRIGNACAEVGRDSATGMSWRREPLRGERFFCAAY